MPVMLFDARQWAEHSVMTLETSCCASLGNRSTSNEAGPSSNVDPGEKSAHVHVHQQERRYAWIWFATFSPALLFLVPSSDPEAVFGLPNNSCLFHLCDMTRAAWHHKGSLPHLRSWSWNSCELDTAYMMTLARCKELGIQGGWPVVTDTQT